MDSSRVVWSLSTSTWVQLVPSLISPSTQCFIPATCWMTEKPFRCEPFHLAAEKSSRECLCNIPPYFPHQIFIFFVSVTVAAVNAQWFGQMTSEIMADMHLIEQSCGLGLDIGLSSNREAYAKLCETDVKYRHLSSRLWLYRLLSSLCNLCCIGCNFYSLCYMAENLVKLWNKQCLDPFSAET